MKKITIHLWYDKEAVQAAQKYISIFKNSKIKKKTILENTPSGSVDIVDAEILGEDFSLISAGPYFKFNQSISLMINFDPSKNKDAVENIDRVWNEFLKDGKAIMPIQEYSWSKRYGWLEDKYGLTWQLILTNPEGDVRPDLLPTLLFTDENSGRAEDAVNFYLSVFKESKIGNILYYDKDQGSENEGKILFADYKLFNLWFAAMDSPIENNFAFNEAVSFIVHCGTQDEIDYYWEKLSAVSEAEQCGWLKDKFGISWQIVPSILNEMLNDKDSKRTAKVTEAFLQMKKFNINELKKAYES
jgi:predicted 3-demethylubiquinone-9 3-methyltransferase (glyoxalase superfamily)